MRVLKCSGCGRQQSSGKFCLDCGGRLVDVVIDQVKFRKIDTCRTSDQLKRDIRNWLTRLGVQQPDIHIGMSQEEASVEYVLGMKNYVFRSCLQRNAVNNLAAVEQFLHYRVLSVERGIETVEQAFKGYEALPDFTNPYTVLGFSEAVGLESAKARFRELAKRLHPDVNQNHRSEFERVKKAMEEIEKQNDGRNTC